MARYDNNVANWVVVYGSGHISSIYVDLQRTICINIGDKFIIELKTSNI